MTVFLIPSGPDKYELYFEPAPSAQADAAPPSSGFPGRLRQRFSAVVREAEEQQMRGEAAAPPPGAGWLARLRHRGLAWVAERIAEQRLLWNLRHAASATAAHPDDLPFTAAHARIREMLRGDYERHRRWLVVDTLLLILSGVLAVIPGPNVVAYYVAFRVVGHWLSMRGATQGLHRTRWSGRACPPLTELRSLVGVDPAARHDRLHAVAIQLSLPHLPVFFDRIAP